MSGVRLLLAFRHVVVASRSDNSGASLLYNSSELLFWDTKFIAKEWR